MSHANPLVRYLHRTTNIAELAYMLMAVLVLVVQYAPQEVECRVLEGRWHSMSLI